MTHSKHISEGEIACPCCGWANMSRTTLGAGEMIRAWLNGPYKDKLLGRDLLEDPEMKYAAEEVWVQRMLTGEQQALEASEYGLKITRGCSCPSHNAAVGGAPESWHLPRRWNTYLGKTVTPGFELVNRQEVNDIIWERECFAHALDFTVCRRERLYNNMSLDNTRLGRYKDHPETMSPWTLDIPATKACGEFWEPIWQLGGWKLYQEVCDDCLGMGYTLGDRIEGVVTQGVSTQFENIPCPTCQGHGEKVWIHADTRGEAVRW